jgi:hypothetical protein
MPCNTDLTPELIEAYRDTNYWVATEPPFVMRVDVPSPELAALYTRFNTDCAAFLTASNPYSKKLDDLANAQRHHQLARHLEALKLRSIEGAGRHPSGDWPAETSFLVLGISQQTAMALGRQFEQNAVVCCGADALPRLVLLR